MNKLPCKYTHFTGKGLRGAHPGLLLSGKIADSYFHLLSFLPPPLLPFYLHTFIFLLVNDIMNSPPEAISPNMSIVESSLSILILSRRYAYCR